MNDQYLVPRLEDLPYNSSPAIQFFYKKTVTLAAGVYTWSVTTPEVLSVLRPLIANSVYYFRSITVVADIDEGDYLSSLVTVPVFQMYLKSTGKQILFREPLVLGKYFQNFDYRLTWFTQREDDELYCSINGVLTQTANLIGKTSITISVILSAQEIVDSAYIARFTQKSYPQVSEGY